MPSAALLSGRADAAKPKSGSSRKAGDDPQAGELLTIAEAAEELGVSQPTVFRWMKDGTLSYLKIGGSTRFERRGLEAIVRKRTGKREAEAASGRCASCGHSVLVEGRLQGTGRLYFRPDKTKFWVWGDSLVGIGAKVCTACGFVQIHADTSKLRKLNPDE